LGLTIKIGVEKAESTAEIDCDYVISSAQTLGRKTGNSGAVRAERFSSRKKSVLYDECHQAGTADPQGEDDAYERSQSEEAIDNLGFAVTDPDTIQAFPPKDEGLLMGVSGTPMFMRVRNCGQNTYTKQRCKGQIAAVPGRAMKLEHGHLRYRKVSRR
jgi:hypothetical protein